MNIRKPITISGTASRASATGRSRKIAKLPPEIVAKLNAAANTALQQPRARQTFLDNGIKPVGGAPQLIADAISNDMIKFRKVIADANLKLE